MPRRSTQGDPETLRKKLIELLTNFKINLEREDLREQVIALIPVNYNLRDLGGSLKGLNESKSGMARMLEYLTKYVGVVVQGDELMVVSGIHDYPRRIRELRKERGWQIFSGVTLNEQKEDETAEKLELEKSEALPEMKTDDYVLISTVQDREAAFRWRIANDIRKERGSVKGKVLKFLLANVKKPVTGEELRYVAQDRTEWARRTRQLRTEEGWAVVTKSTGRPDLPIGVYVLESEKQGLPHDRAIPDRTRRKVLKRDEYTCQECGWNRQQWNPDDPRNLEVHHVQHHARGGGNEQENLKTLCNICHDEVHAKERLNE
jgi:hypothetical protein